MRGRVLALVVAAGVLAGVLVGVMAGPVAAADQRILVGEVLFDPAVAWVPGDERTATVTVRNRRQQAGLLAVSVRSTDPDGLARRGDVRLSVRRVGGPWTAIPVDGRPHAIAPQTLAAGASARIEVRARFDPASANPSQRSTLPLDLRVQITQVAGPADDGGPDDGGVLPATGGVRAGLLAVGAALLGLGLAFLILFRRKDLDEQP